MKEIRFYLEYPSPQEKNRRPTKMRKHSGNVVAVWIDEHQRFANTFIIDHEYMIEAMVGVYDWPDSAVCSGSVSRDYLRTQCVRIREAQTREIHPALFWRLDQED